MREGIQQSLDKDGGKRIHIKRELNSQPCVYQEGVLH